MSGVNSRRYVTVHVSALWTSPTAPRDEDAQAVAPHPHVVAWLRDLDATQARLGVVGCSRSSSSGSRWTSPAILTAWLQDQDMGQPTKAGSRSSRRCSPAASMGEAIPVGCLPRTSMRRSPTARRSRPPPTLSRLVRDPRPSSRRRAHLGLPYLWGGMCDWGLDCSGLVHLSLRRLSVVFPRDADDQYDACEHIPAVDARPGDLFFFAHKGKRPHHVGIVTGPSRMLHAPETGSAVIEEDLTPARRNSLIGAGRLSSLLARTGLTR